MTDRNGVIEFLGLLARITEMAVVTRWADAHWDELEGPLGFTREKPPCDTTISRALAKLSLTDFRRAFSLWLKSVLADREGRWAAAIDGKTCCQGLDANGSPVQMLMFFCNGQNWRWINGRSAATKPTNLEVSKIIFPNC